MCRFMKRTPRLLAGLVVALGLMAAACGSDNSGGSAATTTATTTAASATATTATPATTTTASVQGNITVFAAASLTDAFNAVGTAFTQMYPQAKATFSFDASSTLVNQITQGAPADVFASADQANMTKMTNASLNGAPPQVFATNLLKIIVPAGNPKGIKGVADLANPALKVVLCDYTTTPAVPCGQYAKQILDAAHVTVTPASLEQNVKGVVTKVTTGEADAGVVYSTDVIAAGTKASGVEIPKEINVVAQYPIAPVKTSPNVAVDQAFIGFLLGSQGQAILQKYGFLPPSPA
jgi:molybdate transport system substrate-binding protein